MKIIFALVPFLVCIYIVDKIPLNIGIRCGVNETFILFFVTFDNSWSISAMCLCEPTPYALTELNKFLNLNLIFKFFPAPEYPDFESIIILFVLINLFFIKGINGICAEVG